MPVMGDPISVMVEENPVGAIVKIVNRTGSRHRFDVGGEVVVVDGNTSAVLVAAGDAVRVTCDGRQVWPVESAP